MVKTARLERNSIAHPDFIDFDLVASEIKRAYPSECQKRMNDMLDILKMTASLMKFGRLAMVFPAAEVRRIGENARRTIISWNGNFEEIKGLYNVEHEEGKKTCNERPVC